MKRSEQLQDLSREHHASLVMAAQVGRAVKQGGDEEIQATLDRVKHYYATELDQHFLHEERTIFAIISAHYPELNDIVEALLKEHEYIRQLVANVTLETARKDLAEFGVLLKSHTRKEERELFPQVDTLFTDEQLKRVLDNTE